MLHGQVQIGHQQQTVQTYSCISTPAKRAQFWVKIGTLPTLYHLQQIMALLWKILPTTSTFPMMVRLGPIKEHWLVQKSMLAGPTIQQLKLHSHGPRLVAQLHYNSWSTLNGKTKDMFGPPSQLLIQVVLTVQKPSHITTTSIISTMPPHQIHYQSLKQAESTRLTMHWI